MMKMWLTVRSAGAVGMLSDVARNNWLFFFSVGYWCCCRVCLCDKVWLIKQCAGVGEM